MRNRSRQRDGTSLVELMASIAVLSVLLVLVVQATGAISRTWKIGAGRIDNLSQVRAVMAVIDRDLQSIILRPDLAAFLDENGDPACAFYSLVPGTYGDRRISLVSYAIDPVKSGLTRADYGMDYENRVLKLNETGRLPDLVDPEIVKEAFADGAVAFRCQFQTAEGRLTDKFEYDYAKPEALTNTRSMVLSLVVLDSVALSIARESNLIPEISARLASSAPMGRTYADLWKEEISALSPSLPEPVRRGVRLLERSIPIPCR